MSEINYHEEITFTIQCKMKYRWARQFITMLKTMQHFGVAGCSRVIGFYSDGDGDFRPKFKVTDFELNDKPSIAKTKITDEIIYFDAG